MNRHVTKAVSASKRGCLFTTSHLPKLQKDSVSSTHNPNMAISNEGHNRMNSRHHDATPTNDLTSITAQQGSDAEDHNEDFIHPDRRMLMQREASHETHTEVHTRRRRRPAGNLDPSERISRAHRDSSTPDRLQLSGGRSAVSGNESLNSLKRRISHRRDQDLNRRRRIEASQHVERSRRGRSPREHSDSPDRYMNDDGVLDSSPARQAQRYPDR